MCPPNDSEFHLPARSDNDLLQALRSHRPACATNTQPADNQWRLVRRAMTHGGFEWVMYVEDLDLGIRGLVFYPMDMLSKLPNCDFFNIFPNLETVSVIVHNLPGQLIDFDKALPNLLPTMNMTGFTTRRTYTNCLRFREDWDEKLFEQSVFKPSWTPFELRLVHVDLIW